MTNSKIASRYAMSLMDLADEKNSLEVIYRDAKSVVSVLDSSSELRKVLVNPVIKSKVKVAILNDVFGGRVDPDTIKFIRFIVEKNREEYLYSVMKRFLELRNERMGIVDVEVRTAVDFSEDQKNELKTNLEGLIDKKVQLHFFIDMNVIGGFIARVGDTLYDASIKNQLINLKKQFLQGSTL